MAGVHLLVQFRILRTAERDEEGEVTYFHAPTFLSLGQTDAKLEIWPPFSRVTQDPSQRWREERRRRRHLLQGGMI